MNPALTLHTAARRYCLQQYAFWCQRYSKIVRRQGNRHGDGYHYTAEALAIFPRYNVLNAIRVDLERLDPGHLNDLAATRELLILAGDTADDLFTREPGSDIAKRAMAEEREAFRRYIAGLTVRDLNSVEALPFRRVLNDEESKLIWSRLRGRWQIPQGHWYPLTDSTVPDVMAFKARTFEQSMPHQRLQAILTTRGIARVWELREYGPEYEQDVALFEPYYNGAEGYWSSGDLDWIIYASHESSITVGGWLTNELKAIWPGWQASLWAGLFD